MSSSSSIDIEKVRADTVGLQASLLGKEVKITGGHFNNAGASLMPQSVTKAMQECMSLECQIGGYEAEAHYGPLVRGALYEELAKLVGASGKPETIAITDSATGAWCHAFYSIPFEEGDVILTTEVEYGANYVCFIQQQQKKKVVVEVIPSVPELGIVDVQALRKRLAAGGVRCVAATHIPTNGGVVNPIEEMGEAIFEHNNKNSKKHDDSSSISSGDYCYFVVDACQTVGQKPIDVNKMHCDFLSGAARKYLRGPRGIGFLYVREDHLAEGSAIHPVTLDHYGAPWIAKDKYQYRPDAKRFERWEGSPMLRLGFLEAVKYCNQVGIENIWRRIQILSSKLRRELKDKATEAGVCVRDLGSGDLEKEQQCGLVTFTVEGWKASEFVKVLRETHGFNLSFTTAMATRLDMEKRGLTEMARASVHYFNTEEEVDRLVSTIVEVAKTKPTS